MPDTQQEIDIPQTPGSVAASSRPLLSFAVAAGLLVLAFFGPLRDLFTLSLQDELVSHAPLIPLISAYLVWTGKGRLPRAAAGPRWPALLFAAAGLALFALHPAPEDVISVRMLSFCLLLWAAVVACLGTGTLWSYAFPAGFLLFMVPMPSALVALLEGLSQRASAEVAFRFIDWTGTPVFRNDMTFTMPGLAVQVARECSGIRSSYVLFITSLLAGYLFLRSPWRRLALAAFVIPLGIVRNGFRVFTLSMLTVHVDPWWIHSPLHHQGGPVFFALSLVPFFLVLAWLRRGDDRAVTRGDTSRDTSGDTNRPPGDSSAV